ncbi:unnamed protein product [Coregonus sp. 'balchen']|nr:unnamed protein product [Coregonus sp. 'balchen']
MLTPWRVRKKQRERESERKAKLVTRTKKIFVGGLSVNTTIEDVKQYFDQFGKLRSTQLHLKNVYSSLALCMFVAAAGAYVHIVSRLFQVNRGVGLGPAMDYIISINPSIIVTAFLGTSIIFVCFTLSALYAQRRSFLFLWGTLTSGLSILLLVSFLNMFLGSVMLFKAHVYLGLAIMCGFVLFDTQLIIEKAEMGDTDYTLDLVKRVGD